MASQHHKSIPVMDAPPNITTMKSFRSPLWEKNKGPKQLCEGIEHLRASASGQFNGPSFVKTFKKIPNSQIVVLDLRLESHGFADNMAISWYGKKNAINQGLTLEQITEKERVLLASLNQNQDLNYHEITKKISGIILEVEPKQTDYKTLQTEKDMLASLGVGYKRLPVLDRNAPDDAILDEFVSFVNNLPEDTWLHMHCRGGKGRATTFMVLYDVIKNAKHVSLDTIFERQAFFGPKDLRTFPSSPEKLWKRPMSIERLNKIKLFYQYRQSDDYGKTPWSVWAKQHLVT